MSFLKDVVLSCSVRKIGMFAFEVYFNLESVVVKGELGTIKMRAFYGCKKSSNW